jgi:hypothetical protein
MSAAKRDDVRSAQRWSKPGRSPASGHRPGKLVVRWIGAAKRRLAKPVAAAEIKLPSAQIIKLSWADTFGRPMRLAPAGWSCGRHIAGVDGRRRQDARAAEPIAERVDSGRQATARAPVGPRRRPPLSALSRAAGPT